MRNAHCTNKPIGYLRNARTKLNYFSGRYIVKTPVVTFDITACFLVCIPSLMLYTWQSLHLSAGMYN